MRKEKGREVRARLFEDLGIVDKGQKLLVYAGGNNEEYFSKAWPAFLGFINQAASLDKYIVVLQQHPGAKKESRDAKAAIGMGIKGFFVSTLNTQEVLAAADAMLYYQTSMAAQFVLAEVPTIQAGHRVYADILTKNGLCKTATTGEEFLLALQGIQEKSASEPELIQENLGIRSDWADRLEEFVLKNRGKTL